MNEEKHTKGNWTIVDSKDRIVDEEGSTVASTCFKTSEENEANANLIAAAPELLETLKLIRKTSNYDMAKKNHSQNPNHWTNKIDRAIENATKSSGT